MAAQRYLQSEFIHYYVHTYAHVPLFVTVHHLMNLLCMFVLLGLHGVSKTIQRIKYSRNTLTHSYIELKPFTHKMWKKLIILRRAQIDRKAGIDRKTAYAAIILNVLHKFKRCSNITGILSQSIEFIRSGFCPVIAYIHIKIQKC